MANIIGNGDVPQQKQKIDISQSKAIVCEECGYDVFISGIKFRKLSKFVYGGEQDVHIPFDVMLCGECGKEQESMKPMELRALEARDKMENESKDA